MRLSKEIRRNKKFNISEKSRIIKNKRVLSSGTGLKGFFLQKMEFQY